MKNIFSKILFIFISFLFLCVGNISIAQDAIISEIVIKGNQRVETETIKTYISFNEGDAYNLDLINRDVKNIFASGFFSDVNVSRQGDILLITVIENPIINRISFEGNGEIDDEALAAEVRIAPRNVFTRAKIQDDVERIITVYRRNGRFEAEVNPKVITLPQNRVDIVFEIKEGENTEILSISFVGNENFSDRKLREVIITRQTRWYSILTATDRYDPDQLYLDREELRKFYLDNGYADFSVESSVAQLSKDKKGFNIIFSLSEGKQYTINDVTIENLVEPVNINNALDIIPIEKGRIYSVDKVEEAVDELTDMVINQGHPFIEVIPEVQRVENVNKININLKISPAEKKYVSRIEIEGNDRTLDSVIRRNIRLAEGDAIVPKLIARSRTLITNLGFFESVNLTEVPTEKHGFSDIKVAVIEKPTGELSFGAGYSTTQGGIGNFGISENNFLGKGQKLNIKLNLSGRNQNYSMGFVEPYFYDRDVSLGTNIYDDEYDYRESKYKLKRKGLGLRTNYTLSEYLSQGVNYTFEFRDVDPETGASASIIAEKGETTLSSIGTSLKYDRLDNRMFPTEGLNISLSGNLAGIGGDKEYVTVVSNNKYYIPYDDNAVIFGFALESGATIGLGQDILISDRFFLGGNNFRGFAPAGVGPRDVSSKDSLGGNYYYVGSAKATFGIGLPEELGIKASVFTYVGSISGIDKSSASYYDDFSPRLSTGLGLSWQSPFGPVSISFSQAVIKEDYDKTESFDFGIGTSF